MKKLLVMMCLLGIAGLLQANMAINPNFELDESGTVNLTDRPFSNCQGWDGWGGETSVVQDNAWGDPHPTAQMAARIGPNADNSIWQNTGVVAKANTVYVLSADIKSEYAWQLVLRFESVNGSTWGNTINNWFTPQNHSDWRTYSAQLDTAAHPEYVGLNIGIGVVNMDWDWGRTYATNIQLKTNYGPTDGNADQAEDTVNEKVNVVFQWNAAKDENGAVDPNIVRQDVYLSNDQNTASDPNLYYIGSDFTVNLSDPASQFPETGYWVLDYDESYDWAVVTILADGVQELPATTDTLEDVTDPNNHIGEIWSFDTIASVPIITDSPDSVLVDLNEAVQFTVTVSSISTVSYQWYKSADNANNTPADDTTVGSASDTLSFTNASLANEGFYFCVASNDSGTDVPSGVASLTVKRQLAYWTLDQDDFITNQYRDVSTADAAFYHADPNNPAQVSFVQGPYGLGSSSAIAVNSDTYGNVSGNLDPTLYSNQLTIGAWVKRTSSFADNDNMAIIAKRDNDTGMNNGFRWSLIARNTDQVRLLSWNGTDAWTGSVIPLNEWVYVCASIDPVDNNAYVYVNGVRQASDTNGYTWGQNPGAPVLLGRGYPGGENFPGQLDDIQVYNYGMNNAQVVDLYYAVSGKQACILEYASQYDVANGETGLIIGDEDFVADCKLDLSDFAVYAANWLSCGLYPSCP